ncbi:MAG: SCO family protein [Luteolibacter sp.]
MSKTKTLVVFYGGVAVLCAGILALVNLVLVPRMKAVGQKAETFTHVGAPAEKEWFAIEKDLPATNQAGEEVKLSDLRGKVFLVTEFFAICPHCAARNGAQLREIYDKFRDDPNFHMVCISVDPETDDEAKLKDYATALGAETDDWWFLNAGGEKETHDYLEGTLKFFGIRERTDPEDIEANGRFLHDMGILLVDSDFNVIGKWPLYDAASEVGREQNPGLYEKLKAELFERIEEELGKEED